MSQTPSRCDVLSVNGVSNGIVDVTISSHSFVFRQSGAKVSVGFTHLSSLAGAVFWFVFVLDISK